MKVAILCETSGTIRELMREKWHDVISVDLLPADDLWPSDGHHWQGDAMKWTEDLWNLCKRKAHRVAFENPVGVLGHTEMGKATQYIQPWQFGEPESKKTGLWLHNLPNLEPTCILPKPECGYWENQTPSGQNKLAPSPDSWKLRSKTYMGIAQAIANQWGDLES